jgi:hypothetical protein
MANREQYTAQQMIDALKATRGMKTVAARRLGCAYNTVVKYIDKYPTVKAALDETRDGMGDSIESTLLATALGERDNDGGWKAEPNVSALIFLAKTHPAMRERGYGEMHKHEHSGDVTIRKRYISISPDDWDGDDGADSAT